MAWRDPGESLQSTQKKASGEHDEDKKNIDSRSHTKRGAMH